MRIAASLIVVVLAVCTFSPSYAATTDERSFHWGFAIGAASGKVDISPDPNSLYLNESGLGPTVGFYLEKPLTPIFSATANLEWIHIWDPGLRATSSSNGYFVSVGGVIGRTGVIKSTYASVAVGYSYVDISDLGTPDGETCVSICVFGFGTPYQRGGEGDGVGYRLALGRTLHDNLRAEIAYTHLTGKGSDFPSGSEGEIAAWQFLVRVRYR